MYAERLPWWNLGLIRDLEKRSPGLGYEWAELCVRKLLPDIETEHQAELLADLDDLTRLRSSSARPEDFKRRANEIWYRPNRDLAQSAVSKLYGTAAALHQPEIGKSLMDLAAPVYLLVEGAGDPERCLESCITLYKDMYKE